MSIFVLLELPLEVIMSGHIKWNRVIPYENVEDLEDVADEVKEKLEIIPVKKVKDVLKRLGL